MIGKDLSNIRSVPQFVDEAYMNKIYVDDVILNHVDDIIKEKYIKIYPYTFGEFPERNNGDIHKNNFPEFDDTIFINQKYDTSLKNKKKENLI